MEKTDADTFDPAKVLGVVKGLLEDGTIKELPEDEIVIEIYQVWGMDNLIKALLDPEVLEFLKFNTLVHRYAPNCSADVYQEWFDLYEQVGYDGLKDSPLQDTKLN